MLAAPPASTLVDRRPGRRQGAGHHGQGARGGHTVAAAKGDGIAAGFDGRGDGEADPERAGRTGGEDGQGGDAGEVAHVWLVGEGVGDEDGVGFRVTAAVDEQLAAAPVTTVGGSNVSEPVCAPAAAATASAGAPINPKPNTMTAIALRTTLTSWRLVQVTAGVVHRILLADPREHMSAAVKLALPRRYSSCEGKGGKGRAVAGHQELVIRRRASRTTAWGFAPVLLRGG
jgi:hypothetical protein